MKKSTDNLYLSETPVGMNLFYTYLFNPPEPTIGPINTSQVTVNFINPNQLKIGFNSLQLPCINNISVSTASGTSNGLGHMKNYSTANDNNVLRDILTPWIRNHLFYSKDFFLCSLFTFFSGSTIKF